MVVADVRFESPTTEILVSVPANVLNGDNSIPQRMRSVTREKYFFSIRVYIKLLPIMYHMFPSKRIIIHKNPSTYWDFYV